MCSDDEASGPGDDSPIEPARDPQLAVAQAIEQDAQQGAKNRSELEAAPTQAFDAEVGSYIALAMHV